MTETHTHDSHILDDCQRDSLFQLLIGRLEGYVIAMRVTLTSN